MSDLGPDSAFINYNVYKWGRLGQYFRGPKPDLSAPYVACLGSAQTFGRYTRHPYPALLEEQIGVTVANLASGGAGPGFYLRDSMALEAASNAEVCVIQAMCARSLSNRLFKVQPRSNGRIKGVSKLMERLYPKVDFNSFTYANSMLDEIARFDPDRFVEVRRELKTAWVARTRLLLESIQAKTVLFWFSVRSPEDAEIGDDPTPPYPQFVDQEMIATVAPFADRVVKCVTSKGLPQSLLSNGEVVLETPDGTPLIENRYYPSPEMHIEAAAALAPTVTRLLGNDGSTAQSPITADL